MNRILVPTDFSDCAGFAEKAALEIAKQLNAQIIFMHGLYLGMDWKRVPAGEETKYPESREKVNYAERSLDDRVTTAEAAGIPARKSLVFLENSRNLVNAIIEEPHDMIVLGSHGKGSLKKIIVGSNTGKILRTCKTPVLVLQQELPVPLNFKTIVFASGLEPDTHEALDRLLQFSNGMGAKNLHFVGVTTPNNFKPTSIVLEEMKSFLSRHRHPGIQMNNYNHYNIEAGILEFSKQIAADMIAISNHGRTDISGLFIESIPENLVKYSELPVLSIRV
jgi:nucleotide-binding universal stress UspA family protein